MPTERNNRQSSEISDSKCEEVAKKHELGAYLGNEFVLDRRCLTALLELQRETRRETLMEAAKIVRNKGDRHSDWGDQSYYSALYEITGDIAAELERNAKEIANG